MLIKQRISGIISYLEASFDSTRNFLHSLSLGCIGEQCSVAKRPASEL